MWDANEIEVSGRVMRKGMLIRTVPLRYIGTTSTYTAGLEPLAVGAYDIEILASNDRSANFGHTVTRATTRAMAAKE